MYGHLFLITFIIPTLPLSNEYWTTVKERKRGNSSSGIKDQRFHEQCLSNFYYEVWSYTGNAIFTHDWQDRPTINNIFNEMKEEKTIYCCPLSVSQSIALEISDEEIITRGKSKVPDFA